MSLSQPNAYLPAFSAVCSTALESVFCISTSAPPLMSDCAASVSFGGSNHLLTHTTLVLIFGFTDCAPSVKLKIKTKVVWVKKWFDPRSEEHTSELQSR